MSQPQEPQDREVPFRGLIVCAASVPVAFIVLMITQNGAAGVAFVITLLAGEALCFYDFGKTARASRSNRSE